MKAVLLLAALAALFVSVNSQAYVASIAYLHTPLPCNTDFKPEANQTAKITVAELNQNVTTGYEFFAWELVFTPQPTLPAPVKLQIVGYSASQTPSNQQVILTLANNPNGLQIGTADVQGTFDLATLNAARAAAGYPPAPVCDPKNACEPGPSTLINVADSLIFVLTYADGNVTAGFPALNPPIPYPPPSDDNFYVSEFNGSFAIPPTPALLNTKDDVNCAVFNNFDKDNTWGSTIITNYNTTGAKATAFKLVTIANNVPVTVLDLSSKYDFNSPDIADVGINIDNAFTLKDLQAGFKAANITVPTEVFSAVTTQADQTYVNYDSFEPQWIFDPNASIKPVPKPKSPTPSPKRPSPKPKTPSPKRKSPSPKPKGF